MTREEFVNERFALHLKRCPECLGTGLTDYNAFGTSVVVKIACPRCADFSFRLEMFCKGFFNPNYVMPRYWDAVYLSKLQPSDKSRLALDRQARLLAKVRDNPDQGYAIFGKEQTGKTTVTVGLYAKVLYDELMSAEMKPSYRVPVRRLTSKVLLDQLQNQVSASDEGSEPDVTRSKIIRCFENGSRYRLFIEEIDKVKETDARRANLFEILDTLHGCMGQFVMTSNLTPEKFAEDFGGDFLHRINAMAEIINLHQ